MRYIASLGLLTFSTFLFVRNSNEERRALKRLCAYYDDEWRAATPMAGAIRRHANTAVSSGFLRFFMMSFKSNVLLLTHARDRERR